MLRFKLHLHPPRLAADQGLDLNTLRPLPRGKTVVDIFGDILGFLFRHTVQYIQERQSVELWESVQDNIDFILSHPNGWEGKQQTEMRRAAVAADLVKSELEALERVRFVTEGEASLHFCLGKISSELSSCVSVETLPGFTRIHFGIQANDGILVVDCGGGTIDISSYARAEGQSYIETSPAECEVLASIGVEFGLLFLGLLQGSTFVAKRASEFLTGRPNFFWRYAFTLPDSREIARIRLWQFPRDNNYD